MKTVFLRVIEAEDKAESLLRVVREPKQVVGQQLFHVDTTSFSSVPRSPFSYWVSEQLRSLFEALLPLESEGRELSIGASTKNDFRYVRAHYEVHPRCIAHSRIQTSDNPWVAFAKGGAYSPFYADVHLLVNWLQDGATLKADISEYRGSRGWGYQWSAALNGHGHYFRPGVTWPRRTQGGFSLRAMPEGCIFADKGPAAFSKNNSSVELLSLLATVNSQAFRAMIDMQMAFGSYEVGVLQRTPMPCVTQASCSHLARLAHRAWSLKRTLDTRTETSHAFVLPALLQVGGIALADRALAWSQHIVITEAEVAKIQAGIDELCFTLYDINPADRLAIAESSGSPPAAVTAGEGADTAEASDEESESDEAGDGVLSIDAATLAAELVSWGVSVAFGRFDIRLGTGARPLPAEPAPFDPLPACSPAMLTADDGLPLSQAPADYPIRLPNLGVLIDDLGHADDLTGALRAVFDIAFAADSDRWWHDVAVQLSPKLHDLRSWLADSYFEYHLKRHSKSRRKAPIVWQLATPSGSYSVWLYAHRVARDTLYQLQNDVVGPKLRHEERQLTNLIQAAGNSASAAERKQIDTQQIRVEELRAMLEEIKRISPLWQPNLDDGIVLVMAPLWRLVPQHKAWQKELKSQWLKLVAGHYDWAHLAMHLWPERVVPKCASDRSLAIAHGLEHEFWLAGPDGKYKSRVTPLRSVDDLVAERSSAAVKAALNSLLSAPQAAGKATRSKAGKSNA